MLIGRHSATTRTLGAPPTWNRKIDGECGSLPVADLMSPSGPVMESAWLPNADEIERLIAGAPIILGVLGEGHPPVYLGVGAAPDAL